MRISRVYVESELVEGEHIAFDRDRNHYLKHVLRLKPGDLIDLFNDQDGRDYRATLTLDGKQLGAVIESSILKDTESPLDTTVVQALGRTDHMDWMIQKATELGVNRIAVFNAERTQHPLGARQLDKKLRHWRGVAISACEQCGRARVPALDFYPDLAQALDGCDAGRKLLLHFEGEPASALLASPANSVSILVGPEGGLNEAEIAAAVARGYRETTLGPRVLRFETAAVAALSVTQARLGDFA